MSSAMNTEKSIANVERLHALMDRDGLSALVLRSGTNFTYLAGFDYAGTLARHLDFSDSPRGVLIVWPRSGAPVLVLNRFAVDRARRDSWVRLVVFATTASRHLRTARRGAPDAALRTTCRFRETVSARDWAGSREDGERIVRCARGGGGACGSGIGRDEDGSRGSPDRTKCTRSFRGCAPARESVNSMPAYCGLPVRGAIVGARILNSHRNSVCTAGRAASSFVTAT